MLADLEEDPLFLYHIMHTQEWPDIVIWFDSVKCDLIVELTVPWMKNMEEAFGSKKLWYENLHMDCKDKG